MTKIDLSRAEWHESSYSSQSGNCVEVARNLPGLVLELSAAVSSSMRVCAPPPVRSVAQSTGQVSWGDAHGEGTVGSERL